MSTETESTEQAAEQQRNALEQKRAAAVRYLKNRGICRADAKCGHQYEACPYTPPPPRIDVYRGGIQQPELEL